MLRLRQVMELTGLRKNDDLHAAVNGPLPYAREDHVEQGGMVGRRRAELAVQPRR
jgi:hypothetical protein